MTRGRRALLAALVTAVSACEQTGGNTAPLTNIITGTAGGTWYAIGSGIAEKANDEFDGHPITAVPGAGAVSNPARIGRLPSDAGMSYLPFLRAAFRGERPYRQAFPDLRLIASLVENKLHLIVAEHLKITSFSEIREKRLAVRIGTGPPGSNEEYVMRLLLEESGISYDDIRGLGGRLSLLGTGERVGAWKDRQLDIINFTINDPAPAVTDLMLSRPARVWSLTAALLERMSTHGYVRAEIPPDSYPHQSDTVKTIGGSAVLFTTSDVAETVAYALAKAVAENKAYLETVNSGFKVWSPRELPFDSEVPFHEGALKYYRDRGWVAEGSPP